MDTPDGSARDTTQEAYVQALAFWIRYSGLLAGAGVLVYMTTLKGGHNVAGVGAIFLFLAGACLAGELFVYPLGRALARYSQSARLLIVATAFLLLAVSAAGLMRDLPAYLQAQASQDDRVSLTIHQYIYRLSVSLIVCFNASAWAGAVYLALLRPRAVRLFSREAHPDDAPPLPIATFGPLLCLGLSLLLSQYFEAWETRALAEAQLAYSQKTSANLAAQKLQNDAKASERESGQRLPFCPFKNAQEGDWAEYSNDQDQHSVVYFEIKTVQGDAVKVICGTRRADDGRFIGGGTTTFSKRVSHLIQLLHEPWGPRLFAETTGDLQNTAETYRLGDREFNTVKLTFHTRTGSPGCAWLCPVVKGVSLLAYSVSDRKRLELQGFGSSNQVLWGHKSGQ